VPLLVHLLQHRNAQVARLFAADTTAPTCRASVPAAGVHICGCSLTHTTAETLATIGKLAQFSPKDVTDIAAVV